MSLYNCMGGTETTIPAYYLGTVGNGGTVNVKNKYADYANLTLSNFVVIPRSGNTSASNSTSTWTGGAPHYGKLHDTNTGNFSMSVSYNATSGVLTYGASISIGGEAYAKSDGGALETNHTAPRGSIGLIADVYLLPVIGSI